MFYINTIKEARVTARIDQWTKGRVEEELSKHGLSISEFIRMNLTTVANQGLPEYYGVPYKNRKLVNIYYAVQLFGNPEHFNQEKCLIKCYIKYHWGGGSI